MPGRASIPAEGKQPVGGPVGPASRGGGRGPGVASLRGGTGGRAARPRPPRRGRGSWGGGSTGSPGRVWEREDAGGATSQGSGGEQAAPATRHAATWGPEGTGGVSRLRPSAHSVPQKQHPQPHPVPFLPAAPESVVAFDTHPCAAAPPPSPRPPATARLQSEAKQSKPRVRAGMTRSSYRPQQPHLPGSCSF